jgi:hypothetical protein
MSCEMSKERLIGFAYDDMETGEREQIESHLANCPACRQALADMGQTRGILESWPDERPDMDLVFVREKRSIWSGLLPEWLSFQGFGKFAAGMAVGVASVLLLLSVLHVSVQEGRLTFSLEPIPSPQQVDPLDRPVTLKEFASLQRESLSLVEQMLQDSEERQSQSFDYALTQFAGALEEKRNRDLQLVGRGLEGVELSTQRQLRQLGQLITMTGGGYQR